MGERLDPAEVVAIRVDDEVLDALGSDHPVGLHVILGGPSDDRRLMSLLWAWRADLDSEPWPEPIPFEVACRAAAARRAPTQPRWRRRRLVPLATAATITVLALSGIAVGASTARPGDPLWPVARTLGGDRTRSVEAAYRAAAAITTARRALAVGRPGEARAALAAAAVDVEHVHDPDVRRDLERTSATLRETAETSPEGESIDTDEHGSPTNPSRRPTCRPGHPAPLVAGCGSPSAAPSPTPSPTGHPGRPDPRDSRRGGSTLATPSPIPRPRPQTDPTPTQKRSTRPSPAPESASRTATPSGPRKPPEPTRTTEPSGRSSATTAREPSRHN